MSLAHTPRTLKLTVEVGLAFGIDLVKEPEYLWLADLALSLPLPLGWTQITQAGSPPLSFWYNKLLGTSQWHHPTDHFIKWTLHALREPLHPTCIPRLLAMLGEEFSEHLSDGLTTQVQENGP